VRPPRQRALRTPCGPPLLHRRQSRRPPLPRCRMRGPHSLTGQPRHRAQPTGRSCLPARIRSPRALTS
jgi:hypothetical protein